VNDWQKWMVAAVLALIMAMMGIQWQQAESDAQQNATDIRQVESRHQDDIARLDESNRNRRNQIADLEERIARLEERTK
jgi:hypothetical protein